MEFGGHFPGRVAAGSHGAASTQCVSRFFSSCTNHNAFSEDTSGRQSCFFGSGSLGFGTSRGICIVAESLGRHHESESGQAPDEAWDAAKGKVVSLESSIQALGDADPATLKVLQDWRRPVLQPMVLHQTQKPLSSKSIFMKNHFHQKPLSSKSIFSF